MEEEIQNAVRFLKTGKTILYPTDTIWGIGCDATNQKAVNRVFRIKKRFESKSMIILLDDASKLSDFVDNPPEIAYELINNIDTPLTIIYPKAKNLAKKVIAPDHTIAIRIVKDEFCRMMIKEFGKPIVSTSANISGEPAPLTFHQISPDILGSVDYIVNYYQDVIRTTKPSTIIQLKENGEFVTIRK